MTEKDLQIQELKAENARIRHSNALLEAELMEHRELEQQGLLLKLPCKVGDTVYIVKSYWDCKYNECPKEEGDCGEFKCEHEIMKYFVKETDFQIEMIEMFGKTVFLTKQEAEQALEKMKE